MSYVAEVIGRLPQGFQESTFSWSQTTDLILYQAEISASALDLPSFLDCPIYPQFYWQDPKQDQEIVALGGQTFGLDEFRSLASNWKEKPLCLFYFSSLFDPDCTDDEWADFKGQEAVLPMMMLRRRGKKLTLTLTRLVNHGEDKRGPISWPEMRTHGPPQSGPLPANHFSVGPLASPVLSPNFEQWQKAMAKCLQELETTSLQKVVLARKMIFTLAGPPPVNPSELLRKLLMRPEESLLFFLSPKKGSAFMGRSPERLFRLQGAQIYTEAIAGTRPRGKTPAEDELLSLELLQSPKDREEHVIVADFIEERLSRFCLEVKREYQERPLQLSRLQHLHTLFQGTLRTDANVLDILASLHPTPAVGGFPRQQALDLISQLEPFSRGCYAGPLGWIDGQGADFLVGIRSALLHRQNLHLFAGAGIVKGSTATEEWHETQSKLDNFLQML